MMSKATPRHPKGRPRPLIKSSPFYPCLPDSWNLRFQGAGGRGRSPSDIYVILYSGVLWYGVVWCGLVGVVWFGWCGLVGVEWFGWCGVVWGGLVGWCGVVLCSCLYDFV